MDSSATASAVSPLPSRSGIGWGLLGVLAFSFTVPLTRLAVEDLDPLFVGAGRAVLAGLLAALALAITRTALPSASQWRRLALVTVGAVLGFSLLTTFALRSVPASHAAVVIGLLPAATAVLAVIRGKERPTPIFWIASACGAVSVIAFTAIAGGGLGGFQLADLLLFAAVLFAAMAYSEGALLAREIGAWQTVSWALILGLPITVTLTVVSLGGELPRADTGSWLSFVYLGCVSMYLGFFPWYRGLALGPIASVSQTQLVQPVLSIVWAWAILGESLTVAIVAGGTVVIAFAWLALRTRVRT